MFDLQEAERFIINVQIYAKVANERLPVGYNVNQVIRHLRTNVAICRQIMNDNNKFIDKFLKPFFDEPENISRENMVLLLDFARQLHHPYYSRQNERIKLDSFLALDIYNAIIKKASIENDTEMLIKCWFGIGDIYYFLSGALYAPNSVAAIRRALKLIEDFGGYFNLKDKNTRLCAAACYNKLAISTYNSREAGYEEKFLAIDNALEFYKRKDVQEMDPDFPWQIWIDDVNGNIYYMGIHYEFMREIGQIPPDLAERVYNFNRSYFTAEELAQLESDNDEICGKFINESIHTSDSEKWSQCIQYIIPAYHSGHIDKNRYIKLLQFCHDAHLNFQSVSPDPITELLRFDMRMVISAILARYTKDRKIGAHLFEYLHKLPKEVLNALPTSKEELKTVVENTLDASNKQSYIDVLLTSTTHNHLPTYVHSMMVSHLMNIFVSWFIDNKPELLVGMCGAVSAQEVQEKRKLILTETRLAGLAHDIGKIAYIQAVSVISRRLTDTEFTLIKRHTDEGEYYLEDKDFGCIPDVIRGHHKTNDGRSGYSLSFDNTKSRYKIIIDICTVSDCIDAATDDIGRSYQQCKTGDAIMDEIISQSGNRYNFEITEALRDSVLRESINNTLQYTRPECYFKAYYEMTN